MLVHQIGYMGFVYLLPEWLSFIGFHVGEYANPMDPVANLRSEAAKLEESIA